jgi:hypothetical protein
MLIEARKVAKKGDLLGGHNIKMTIGNEVIIEHIEQVGKREYCVWFNDEVAINGKTTLEIAKRYAAWMLWKKVAGIRRVQENRFFAMDLPEYTDVKATFRITDNERRMQVSIWWHTGNASFSVLSHNGEWKQFDTYKQRNTLDDVAEYIQAQLN